MIEISIALAADIRNDTPVRSYVTRLYPDVQDYAPATASLSPSMWTMPETRTSRVRPYIARLFAEPQTATAEPVDAKMEARMQTMRDAHDEAEQKHGFASANPGLLLQLIEGLKKL